MILSPNKIALKLPKSLQFTDEEFFLFCQENRDLKFERTPTGTIIAMTPTGGETGRKNTNIIIELGIWNRQYDYGIIFDSSTGFTLPDDSVLAPDASAISHQKWNALTLDQKKKFPPICPEFIVELKSESDQITDLQQKMQNWLNNGIQLGWLIDPDNEKVYIYQPDEAVEIIEGFDQQLPAGEVLKDFALDLTLIR